MRHASCIRIIWIIALTIAGLPVTPARAGDAHGCRACGPGIAGMETPYGDTGCGPRYRGEIHEPSCPDPCDACNRWRGHHGGAQAADRLAPWQLPPGRGFMPAEQVGYDTRSACRRCGR